MSIVQSAIEHIGPSRVAGECGVSPQAVHKWIKAGRLPRTEWTGETNYSAVIERLSDGKFPRSDLLQIPSQEQTA